MDEKPDIFDKFEVIDYEMIQENFEGDLEMAQFSANLFLETYPDILNTVQEIINKKDAKELNEKAHSLKGVTNQIGARKVGHIFYKLEVMGSQGETEGSEEIFAELKPLLEKLTEEAKLLSAMKF